MSARSFEAYLARIYVDAQARAEFRSDPRTHAMRAGLSESESAALEKIDWIGLELAARSFARKRRQKAKQSAMKRTLRSLWVRWTERAREELRP